MEREWTKEGESAEWKNGRIEKTLHPTTEGETIQNKKKKKEKKRMKKCGENKKEEKNRHSMDERIPYWVTGE